MPYVVPVSGEVIFDFFRPSSGRRLRHDGKAENTITFPAGWFRCAVATNGKINQRRDGQRRQAERRAANGIRAEIWGWPNRAAAAPTSLALAQPRGKAIIYPEDDVFGLADQPVRDDPPVVKHDRKVFPFPQERIKRLQFEADTATAPE